MSKTGRFTLMYLALALSMLALAGAFALSSVRSRVPALGGCLLFVLSMGLFGVAIAVGAWAARTTWTGRHAGSTIRVHNTPFHEQLFVDEQLVAQHQGLSLAVNLRGTATIGGQPATVAARISGLFTMSCRCYVDGAEVPIAELEA